MTLRRGSALLCAACVGMLAAVYVRSGESEAELLARAKRHLESRFEPERGAALRVLVAIRSVDAAHTALAYFQAQASPDTVDLKACVPLLAQLPPDELF